MKEKNKTFKIYTVWYNGTFIGETTAPSPEKAINNVRYRRFGRCCSNIGFTAINKEKINL